MALSAGSIAFTGFNGDGNDNLSFVALADIPQGTVINFTDSNWNGSSFASGGNAESTMAWTATSAISAGTVININNIGSGTFGASVGTVSFTNSNNTGLSNDSEVVYAYIGTAASPTFLAAISTVGYATADGTLTGTGLVAGQTAVSFTGGLDIVGYNGPRSGQVSFAAYLAALNNSANWQTQNGSGNQSADGTGPDAPFPTTAFSVTAPAGQSISFSPASVSVAEGNSGSQTLTFTVVRSGGTTGAVNFSGTFGAGSTNAADYGGTLPGSTFSGTIAAGATSAIVTITISGDTLGEANESFNLTLTSATNASATVTIGTAAATGTITNDDGTVISSNSSAAITLANNDQATILGGVTLSGATPVTWVGGSTTPGSVLNNLGTISGTNRAIYTSGSTSGSFTVHNEAGATITAVKDAIKISNLGSGNGTLTIDNKGTISSTGTADDAGQALDLDDIASANVQTVITNAATGVIQAADADAIRAGTNATINNFGQIVSHNGSAASTGNDAIDFQASHGGGVINNFAGGVIQGARHGITGDQPITVSNGGAITGQAGAGINMDTTGATTTVVTNTATGTITGNAVNGADGDGVDVDGKVAIDNYGTIRAIGLTTGANGLNEAIAVGGGTIHNRAGGQIVSDQRAITIDDSNGGSAFGATTITNEGTIQGGNGEAISITGAFADTITNSGVITGSVATAGGADTLTNSGTITGNVVLGEGDDTLNLVTGSTITGTRDGGLGTDTVNLSGTGTGALGATTGFENLVAQEGTWSVAASDYANVTIEDGATVTSAIALNNDDHLTIEAGGKLTGAISRAGNGNTVVDNSGLIEVSGRVLNAGSSTGTLTLNNLAGATIKQVGSDTDVIRPGQNATVNNWGTITTAAGFVGGGDLIDFQSSTGGKVNNHTGGWMEGSRHAVTGDNAVTVVNDGTMIGRNGSAVNIDNGGTEAEKVFVTNRGTMEGRSAALSDSDGDAVDVDGLAQILNYGRIAGLGANGRHDGEPNVSEGIAIGGGTILNYGANAEIYGYGRAIQVDNSSNSNALGSTFINNEGLIKGDGHGPEGVTLTSAEVATFDLRGNEAIKLVGDYADEIINGSTGRIVGGVSMGGGNDHLQSMGSFTATGGSAIDMGAGNDTVYFYTGTTVQGTVLLGTGDDLVLSTADSALVIDAGDGDDQMYISGYTGGNDTLSGGAGNDVIYAGLGNDQIDGGADNDTLSGEDGNDVIDGGAGDDHLMGGNGADTLRGGEGNDRIEAGAGDIVAGGTGDDVIEVSIATGSPASIDGGEGNDTVNLYGTTGSTATGGIGQAANVETMNVVSGNWTLDYFFAGANLNVRSGAAIVSAISLEGGQTLTVEQGGLVQGAKTAIWISGGNVDAVVVNSGTINVTAAPGTDKADAISLNGATATIHNTSTGLIEGGRHAITGPLGITVINDAGGLIVGNNGSAVNMDNGPDVSRTAYVTNYGTMLGRSANISDSDGDAIDVDGLAAINNYGVIRGEGHNGYHKGEANVSEGIAIGGGVINNYASGTIYGYGRAIQVDNSSNAAAFASTTIYNEGTIQGDGHAPTGVAAAHAAAMLARIVGGEAINIVGTHADTITNKGTIIGGIKTDGGADRLSNSGAITATGGSAVNMGADNDTLSNSGTIIGDVLMGGGDDSLINDGQISATAGSAVDMGEGGDLIVNRGTITGKVLSGAGDDEIINVSTGRILGDVVMGADRDKLGQSGLITGNVDMGDGDDVVNLYVGASVGGAILLGAGNDLLLSTADSAFVIDAGDGNDEMYISSYTGRDDILSGGAGNDVIYAGLGNDQIDGGADNDTLSGEDGDDVIDGGAGDDHLMGGNGADTLRGGEGNDRIEAGAGDIVAGGAGDDVIEVSIAAGSPVSIDGGDGIDTLKLSGAGNGAVGRVFNVEKLVVQSGAWGITDASDFSETTVESGATLVAYGNGTDTTVAQGGTHYIWGTATGSVVSGQQIVGSGSTASETLIASGGEQIVHTGGVSSAAIIAGGDQAVYGSATQTTIGDGGLQSVYGSATDTTVGEGGMQAVYADGTASGTTLNAGGTQIDWGAASDTTINGGAQYVWGTAAGTTISSGVQYVEAGGTANATTINGGGEQVIHDGGVSNLTTILGGDQTVYGSANQTTVGDGGLQSVHGSVTGTLVNGGGEQSVHVNGVATGTTLNAGGVQINWGTAIDTTINGGNQYVWGTASGTTIVSGTQYVVAGGFANDTTIDSGGLGYVHTGGTLHDVTFAGAGGTLVLDEAAAFSGEISGWEDGDRLVLGDIDFGESTTLAYVANAQNTGGILTVSDGTHAATLELLGQYTAADFAISADGYGGTVISDPGVAQQNVLAPALAA